MRKIILENPLAPGDIVVSTAAIRDLHLAHPGEFLTDIRCPTGCEQIFQNNPHITKLRDDDGERVRMSYEDIHKSGQSGRPFTGAYHIDLAKALKVDIPQTSLLPAIYLSQDEILWPSPVVNEHGYDGKYWIINAGVKNDYTLKFYPFYQEVIDALAGKVQFVQVGQLEHFHPPLKGVLDMRGKTDLRQLFRLSYHAQGAVCAVSLQMVVMGALQKPCVVVAGGREPVRWQLFPHHRFLAVNGAIECAQYDGCWKSKKNDCVNLIGADDNAIPLCMKMIKPSMIVEAIEMYYEGHMLERDVEGTVNQRRETMSKTAKSGKKEKPAKKVETPQVETPAQPVPVKPVKRIGSERELELCELMQDITSIAPAETISAMMNTMRILKKINPGDTYYEAYLGMRQRYGAKFFDTYQVLWAIGIYFKPKRILEIGTRTGISMCQLLSAHEDLKAIEKIVCVDPFDQFTSANLVRTNLRYLNLPNTPEQVAILAIRSQDYFAALEKQETKPTFDYILVDGDHDKSVAGMDLENAHNVLEEGGIIVFDDISTSPGECALIDVWEGFKAKHENEYLFAEIMEGKGVAIGIKK